MIIGGLYNERTTFLKLIVEIFSVELLIVLNIGINW